jgi:hypothetical protein
MEAAHLSNLPVSEICIVDTRYFNAIQLYVFSGYGTKEKILDSQAVGAVNLQEIVIAEIRRNRDSLSYHGPVAAELEELNSGRS